jgi:hypothetical protein
LRNAADYELKLAQEQVKIGDFSDLELELLENLDKVISQQQLVIRETEQMRAEKVYGNFLIKLKAVMWKAISRV